MRSRKYSNQDKVKVSLLCEDRVTSKKCVFTDIIVTQPQTSCNSGGYSGFRLNEILENSFAVRAFLEGQLIFVEKDGIDLSIGVFPFSTNSELS